MRRRTRRRSRLPQDAAKRATNICIDANFFISHDVNRYTCEGQGAASPLVCFFGSFLCTSKEMNTTKLKLFAKTLQQQKPHLPKIKKKSKTKNLTSQKAPRLLQISQDCRRLSSPFRFLIPLLRSPILPHLAFLHNLRYVCRL